MQFSKYFIVICLSVLMTSCGNTNTSKQSGLSINTNTKSIAIGDKLNLSINNPKNFTIEKVSFSLNGNAIEATEELKSFSLGKNNLEATIAYEGKTEVISKTIEIFNDKQPDIYTYEVVNTYPHDITSYTQGLEFFNGELYESTGQRKESKLRKVDYKTGEPLKNINLDDAIFGEGLTIFNNKIYQLTWQANTGFVYDINTFEKVSSFKYGQSKEGWGLCNDGKRLYKSDGTEKIWFLNGKNLTEEKHIEVYTEKGKIPSLNELEWIDGKIFANIYQRNGVVIINPENGAVEGVIDFKPLRKLVTQHDELDVLNGIAYHPERKTIFITGKNWDKLFEVTIKKK